jgi:fucose permease
MRQTLRLPILWLSLLVVFAYAGAEVSRSTWMFSILTGGRHLDTAPAGLWVTLSLASFTLGRVFFGLIGDRVRHQVILRTAMTAAIIGALLLWWNPVEPVGYAGLLLLCFAQSPTFPLFILGTAERLGLRHSANAIGMQVSASGAGVALLPAIGGVISQHLGVTNVLPYIVLLSVLVFIFYEATAWNAARLSAAELVAVSAD